MGRCLETALYRALPMVASEVQAALPVVVYYLYELHEWEGDGNSLRVAAAAV